MCPVKEREPEEEGEVEVRVGTEGERLTGRVFLHTSDHLAPAIPITVMAKIKAQEGFFSSLQSQFRPVYLPSAGDPNSPSACWRL